MSRSSRIFTPEGRLTKNTVENQRLSSSEVARILREKERKQESTSCPSCKKFKKPGFKLCFKCQQIKNMLYDEHKKSPGARDQEKMRKRFSPNRKNRKRSYLVDRFMMESLSKCSKPNDAQYRMSVKTILRKLSPLHSLADDVKETSEEVARLLSKLEKF